MISAKDKPPPLDLIDTPRVQPPSKLAKVLTALILIMCGIGFVAGFWWLCEAAWG